MRLRALSLLLLLGAACADGPGARALRDDERIGLIDTGGYRLTAERGLLHAREVTEAHVELRASCREFAFEVERKSTALGALRVDLWNIDPGLRLRAPPGVFSENGMAVAGATSPTRPLAASWTLTFPLGVDRVRVETEQLPEGDFTFLAFGDIQEGITRFDDVIAKVNEEQEADFILMLGDLTSRTGESEFDEVEAAYARIKFPILATPGNHDVSTTYAYQRRFGRASYSCTHRGARFTALDSSAATLAPAVWEEYERWLAQGAEAPHVVFSHIPATEVTGTRSGQWNSRREARHFVSASSSAGVDLLLFGHVHSHDEYSLGGIPAHISGGCGAIEERLDGIDRHFLRVKVRGGRPEVEVIRVE